MDAAAKLKTWRLGNDYTLEDAGRVLVCDFTTISKLENRWQHPGLDLALKIERVAGIQAGAWGTSKLVRPKKSPKKRRKSRARESSAPGEA